jgi:hypothetical protein
MLGKLAKGAVISAAAAFGWMAASAPASATAIIPNAPTNGEPGLYQIMNNIYGSGNYTQVNEEQSEFWRVGNYDIKFDVRYAADNGAFGFVPAGGTTPTTLMTLSGTGTNVIVNPMTAALTPGQTGDNFTFTYTDTTTGKTWSTDPGKNADGQFHEILFVVNLPNQAPGDFTFVMAWEDGTDFDFQDSIIQFNFSPAHAVPEPATLSVLGMTLLGFSALRFRRKRS